MTLLVVVTIGYPLFCDTFPKFVTDGTLQVCGKLAVLLLVLFVNRVGA